MLSASTRLRLRLCAALLLYGAAPASASAAEIPSLRGLVAPGALLIDGAPVRCGGTPALISEGYPDYGAARPGLIILNPTRLKPLPPSARLLIYYHECAHQFVGASELAADCWAVQKVRREGLLDREGLKEACEFVKDLPGNQHHPPGQLRCRHMMRCYDDTYRIRAETSGSEGEEGVSLGFSVAPQSAPDP